ncbi:MAG: hypothetical protein ACTHXO_03445 [Actinomycetaceae bacterium]
MSTSRTDQATGALEQDDARSAFRLTDVSATGGGCCGGADCGCA